MPEDIMDRLNRLANAGRKPKVEEPKRVFTMPVKAEPVKGKGFLDRLLDEVDLKHSRDKRVR